MTSPWFYALVSVVAVSLVSLMGLLTVSWTPRRLEQVMFVMVSVAVGAMFGNVFLHLLPSAFDGEQTHRQTSLMILAGLMSFLLMEKFLWWRHEHLPSTIGGIQPVGYMSLLADGLHNFIDGLLIGASYLVDTSTGLGTTIAILLHEIPQEIGDFGVLLHAGFTKPHALLLNFLTALLAIVGAVTALWLGHAVRDFPVAMLPFAAGGFLYIAGSDLVPELHKERDPLKSLQQLGAIAVGLASMFLVALLE